MANSRADLLQIMRGKSMTNGWGAVSIFNRTRVNRILDQQFVTGFSELSILPAFSGRIYLDTDHTLWADLEQIYLTKPLLSFETATLADSKVTLTFLIISGSYTLSHKYAAEPEVLDSTFKISEQQGFSVRLEVPLNMVIGHVQNQGQVTLNISDGLKFNCNLGSTQNSAAIIGSFIKAKFDALPSHKRVFHLGTLDFNGYGPISPTNFHIFTQAAPGANIANASNYGDGGVLIFIKLAGNTSDGSFPSIGQNYPYFIPDDLDEKGDDRYSASIILSNEFIKYLKPGQLPLLGSLLFPGENVFEEESTETPFDRIVFGNVNPAMTSLSLTPLISVIKAGGRQQFSVERSRRLVNAGEISWSVRSLNTLNSAGSISQGVYTSVSAVRLGRETVRNIVTASYVDPASGLTHSASALVMVAYEGMAISPLITRSGIGSTVPPTMLSASTLSGNSLTWSLVEPALGTLSSSGNTALYTPPATMVNTSAVQKIQAQDAGTGEVIQSSMLLLKSRAFVDVVPSYTPSIGSKGVVRLEADFDVFTAQARLKAAFSAVTVYTRLKTALDVVGAVFRLSDKFDAPAILDRFKTILDDAAMQARLEAGFDVDVDLDELRFGSDISRAVQYQWHVISGEGTIDSEGVFTAPAVISSPGPVTIIMCEAIYEGYSFKGYSIIQLSDLNEEVFWKDLVNFKITAPANQVRAYANGYQQIALDVEIETALVGNVGIPITTEELSTLTIVDRNSGQNLTNLPINEEGIGIGDAPSWAVSWRTNQFDAYGLSAPHPHLVEPSVEGDPITRTRVYIVTRDTFPKTVHARFISSFAEPYNSNLTSDEPPRTIELIPVRVPVVTEAQYSFLIRRVAGGGNSPPEQDDYDLILRSTDYWYLNYVGATGLPVKFVSLLMTGLQSTVQWESRRVNESMFSYTGYVFNDGAKPSAQLKLVFDDELKDKILSFNPPGELVQTVAVGELLISLIRVDNAQYVPNSKTEEPLKIILLDRDGNYHGISVGFLPMSVADSRNKLVVKVI